MRFVLEINDHGERECEESGTTEALADMLLQASHRAREGHTEAGTVEDVNGLVVARYKLEG